LIQRI
jgi:hypothetical protein